MREKLIEAMARAISRASGWPQDMWDNPEEYSTSRVAKEAYVAFATTALDAALDMLETPPPEMVDAALWKHQLEGDKALHRGLAYATFTDMLATLRSPKI